jgi:hypothetical protein
MKKLFLILVLLAIPALSFSQSTGIESASHYLDLMNMGFDQLEVQMKQLTDTTISQSRRIAVLEEVTNNANKIIAEQKINLECAMERVTDAEQGAIAILDENTQFMGEIKSLKTEVKLSNQETSEARKIIFIIALVIIAYVVLRILKIVPQTKAFFFWVP